MGKRNKSKRVQDVKNFSNVMEGNFGTPSPIEALTLPSGKKVILELGCGKGKYTLALAEMAPENLYIGVDVKAERLWIGAKYAREHTIENAQFLHAKVNDIDKYFEAGSISEIWVTFPDPFPRSKHAKHRLTAPNFLGLYKQILVPGGIVHLKTDDLPLYEYTLDAVEKVGGKVLRALANIYLDPDLDAVLQIQTDFEKKHLAKGKKIYYIQFSL